MLPNRPRSGTVRPMERRCGFKGCVEYALPAAYVELEALTDNGILTVRVEACAGHFHANAPLPALIQ